MYNFFKVVAVPLSYGIICSSSLVCLLFGDYHLFVIMSLIIFGLIWFIFLSNSYVKRVDRTIDQINYLLLPERKNSIVVEKKGNGELCIKRISKDHKWFKEMFFIKIFYLTFVVSTDKMYLHKQEFSTGEVLSPLENQFPQFVFELIKKELENEEQK